MAAGIKSDIIKNVYLVKLLTSYIRFDLKFRGSYPYVPANSLP